MTCEISTMAGGGTESAPFEGAGVRGDDGSPASWLWRSLSTGGVLVALGGVAAWGHHTDWRFGRGGSVRETGIVEIPLVVESEPAGLEADPAEGCSAHGLARCPHCVPTLAQLDVPPAANLDEAVRIREALSRTSRGRNARACPLVHHRVRLDSSAAAEKLGIEASPAWRAPMSESITASGETAFDPTRVAHLASRMHGSASRVLKRLGSPVRRGEILALIESGEIGRAKAEFQQALVQLRLRRKGYENARQAPVAEQQRREALAALRDAEARVLSTEQTLINFGLEVSGAELADMPFDAIAQRLQYLGIPDELVQSSDEPLPGTLLPVVSPLEGIVTECALVAGEVVEPSRRLFTIADPSQLVLTLHVAPAEAVHVRVGQGVRFRPDGARRDAAARVTWIAPTAKERTRTVAVRAELDNRDGRLLAAAFGQGRIVLREEPRAVVVPRAAVQSEGDCELVFVRDKGFLKPGGPHIFHVRSVRTGARDEKLTEILAGVLPGEIVASEGAELLLGQLRRHHHARLRPGAPGGRVSGENSNVTGTEHGISAR